MARMLFAEIFGLDLECERDAVIYIGDSPNDEPMFAFFPHSVAVANIKRFLPRLVARPAYLTERAGGDGFVEFAEALLAARHTETRDQPALIAGGRETR